MKRCFWVDEKSEIYVKYHDEEWGVPKYDDRELFELLILESFQAGLSWITVLKKREAFREAFDDFDVIKVSQYDEKKVAELLNNEKIIRSRGKINAAINNAKIALAYCNPLRNLPTNKYTSWQNINFIFDAINK